MERYLKSIKHNWLLIILTFLVFYLLTFFMISFVYNNMCSYYHIEVKSNYDVNSYFSEIYFRNTMDEIAEHNLNASQENKISYADIDYEGMLKDIEITNVDNIYTIKIKARYFTDLATKTGTVKLGSDRCIKYLETILNFNDVHLEYVNEEKIVLIGEVDPYPISLTVSFVATFAAIILIIIYTSKNKELKFIDISDNDRIYKHPFNKKYWSLSKTCFTKVKNLTNISILFALLLIGKMISLPSGFGALGISFTYIIFSIIAMIYGPLCGIVIGVFSDVLGHVMFQSGTLYFFGYAVRIIVNMFINVVLGTIWWKMLYGLNNEATMMYLTTIAIPKNIIYLLPQTIILYIVIKALAGPLKIFNLIEEEIADNITLW